MGPPVTLSTRPNPWVGELADRPNILFSSLCSRPSGSPSREHGARELAVLEPSAPARSSEWHAAARRARLLSWLSLAWMGAEGAIAITAGIIAGSIALISFGLDSAIEGFASLVIVWRFTGWRLLSHAAEERAQKLVAIQFLLAPYVTFEALHTLVTGDKPQASWVGIALVTRA